jgi:ATP-dependent Clp protease ATP-binding subunit ClpC
LDITLSEKQKLLLQKKVLISNLVQDLKRAIQKYVEDSLAEEIITSKISIGDEIFMDIEEGSRAKCKVHKAEEPTKQ